jgi:hypothetical protein
MVTKATISNHPAPQEIPVLLQRSSVRAPGSPSSFVPWRPSNRNPLFLIDQKQIFFFFRNGTGSSQVQKQIFRWIRQRSE